MKTFSSGDIVEMDKRFRANFINSISGFKSANLIGTVNNEGRTNLAIFSSVIHIGANPPLIGFILRPTTVERHTYNNIIAKRFYTISALPFLMKEDGHRTSAKYPKGESEFDKTSFTPEFNDFDVPYIKESPIALTCELKSEQLLEVNHTRLIIGEVKEVKLNPKFLNQDGFYALAEAGVSAISGMDSYHQVEMGSRFDYARPDQEITFLPQ
ncbi:flavin reductase family protein [Cryomorphaceae bacterium 1068]|nr:flavin reductase family protein [Cryomorphaceae bacterium 1068]